MSCVTDVALERMAPRPIPGKTYMLLPWPGVRSLPLYSMEGNGEPEANRQRPSVLRTASSNVHSDLLEGLDKGKMTGCLFSLAIFWMISLLKAPPMVDRPIRIVGWT